MTLRIRYYTLYFFKDVKKQWRWHLIAPNGRIVADCCEGYKRKNACVKMARAMMEGDLAITEKFEK